MKQGTVGRERKVPWLRMLNASLENWVLSLHLPKDSYMMPGKQLKPKFSQVATMCLIFWMPNLHETAWGLICKSGPFRYYGEGCQRKVLKERNTSVFSIKSA